MNPHEAIDLLELNAELLAALRIAKEVIDGHFQDDCEDCMAASAAVADAIAKAEGRS